jgi:lipopolysaccharide/colanic/teichoic acid biosynthesis glycosyltransferase
MSPLQELLKRGFDVVGATASLMLLSPLIFFVSLAIKLDSRGPIFCPRKYYDLNDAVFEAFEFRCWTSTGDNISNPTTNSRMGQVLRHSGIDKIPQLINVLHGDMSIVGPQPLTNASGAAYRTRMTAKLVRNVRPGIVSWAQVRACRDKINHTPDRFQRRIEDDCYYLANRSFLLDVKILVLALLLGCVDGFSQI